MAEDIDEFLERLPREEQVITKFLRSIILDCDPHIQEKLAYGVPYFFRKRRVCFIWPHSAPYGPKDTLVSLGFCYGCQLSNEQKILLKEGRTQVSIVKYTSLASINQKMVQEILQEALMVDDLPFDELK